MSPSRSDLLAAAKQFCDAFSEKRDITTLISFFSTTHQVSVIEHGLPALAPFLGRTFTGIRGVKEYFELISSLLSYEDMTFSEFVVDSDTNKVAMKGQSRFTWLSTDESWEEAFSYIVDFDEELKIAQYQVWADSGAAYLARKGKLKEVRA
jgi:hypothetical protein